MDLQIATEPLGLGMLSSFQLYQGLPLVDQISAFNTVTANGLQSAVMQHFLMNRTEYIMENVLCHFQQKKLTK